MSERASLLQGWLDHPGTKLFIEHALDEWGPRGAAYNREMDKALDVLDTEQSATLARQIRAARRAVEGLLRWAEDEIARERRNEQVEPVSMSRGGY